MSYIENYNKRWKKIIENKDGSINKDQVMKELADFSMLIENLTKLYSFATGNRVSYTTTLASEVYSLFEEELQEQYDNGYYDAKVDFKVEE